MENKIGVGVGVFILKEGKVLLGKRHGDPEKATSLLQGAGRWTMPGGKLDFGESFEDGIARETLEECGIIINNPKVICINNDQVETAHFVTIGLFCDEFEGEAKVMEPDKIVEWHWFELDNLPDPMYFPSLRILENYKHNKFYIKRN